MLFILTTIITYSCKKENGHTFLRIIPVIDTSITSLNVSDANGSLIIDGNYHEVNSRLELSYVLNNMVEYEEIGWTQEAVYDHYTYSDFAISKYFGEFEKLEDDRYYTLNISYISEKSDPIYNNFTGYYFYSLQYYDKSKMIYSDKP